MDGPKDRYVTPLKPTALEAEVSASAPAPTAQGSRRFGALSNAVDWELLALHLIEAYTEPVLLLDASARIRVCNRSAETLLGWGRERIVGQAWGDAFSPGAEMRGAEFPIRDALRGALRSFDAVAVTRSSKLLALQFDLAPVGQTAVLAVVVESTVFPSIEEPADLHYEVSAEPGSVGIIERVWSGLPLAERQTAIGKMCFHALHGRDEACQGCPVFEGDVRDRKPTVTLLPDGEPSIRILTVHATTNRTLYLSAHPVDDDLIGELLQARISALATASGLSRRERSVLRYLLLGRSLDEVGKILGISTRTVRFHQTNLLEKLGADSRLDILRLLS